MSLTGISDHTQAHNQPVLKWDARAKLLFQPYLQTQLVKGIR